MEETIDWLYCWELGLGTFWRQMKHLTGVPKGMHAPGRVRLDYVRLD